MIEITNIQQQFSNIWSFMIGSEQFILQLDEDSSDFEVLIYNDTVSGFERVSDQLAIQVYQYFNNNNLLDYQQEK